jgi:hypothetical protein
MHENAAGRGCVAASLLLALGYPAAATEGKMGLWNGPENAAARPKAGLRVCLNNYEIA